MKTMLKSLAMSAMLLSGMAVASGPTLYGKLHMSVDVMDNGGSSSKGTQYNETSLNSNASRIGVKGSEDVGNGFKVGYLIEWQLDMTGDGESMVVRNRAITVSSSDYGTALVGKWDTPMKRLGRKVELFTDQVGDLRNMTSINAGGINSETIDQRWDNVIQYVTPDMAGFKVAVAYSTDTNTDLEPNNVKYSGDNQDNDGYSMSVVYDRSAYMVGLAYVKTDANGDGNTSLIPTVALTDNDQKAWRLAGKYSPTENIDLVASYTDIQNAGFIKQFDTDVTTVGGSYKMGNNKLKLQYAVRDDFDNIKDSGADMTTIGLDHFMSKRTTMYVAYSMVNNDSNSGNTPWLVDHDSQAQGSFGDDADVFSIGIIHKF